MDLTGIIAGGVLEVGALALTVGLWRGREGVVSKALWTAILLVPFFGIIAYAWHVRVSNAVRIAGAELERLARRR